MGDFDGSRIRRARRIASNMTQGELARRVNVTQSTISLYEAGKAIPPADVVGHIARVLDVPVGYFYGEDEAALSELGVRTRSIGRLTDHDLDILVSLARQLAARNEEGNP